MRSEGQKKKLLLILRLLERETDNEHGVDMERILAYLAENGVAAERKSVCADLHVLCDDFGMDIQFPKGRDTTYRLRSREFDLAELKLIIDSLQASKFLSAAKTRDLITKIEKQCSIHEAKELNRGVLITNRVKSMNNRIFHNIDRVRCAMAEDVRLSFRYFMYDLHGKEIFRRNNSRYLVSPWALIYLEDQYYLLAYENGEFRHFRVDRMVTDGHSLTRLPREGRVEFEKIDLSSYTKRSFYMYGGEAQQVTLRIANKFASVAFDRFGHDTMLTPDGGEHFLVTVPLVVSPPFYGWLFSLGAQAEIVEPGSVRDGFRAYIEEVRAKYAEEE